MKSTLKVEATTLNQFWYCYSCRRATENMSATLNSSTMVWTYVPYRYQQSLFRCITCQEVCIQ